MLTYKFIPLDLITNIVLTLIFLFQIIYIKNNKNILQKMKENVNQFYFYFYLHSLLLLCCSLSDSIIQKKQSSHKS